MSFLSLSHAFERAVGYYLPIMTGSTVAFARSVQELPQDLLAIRPTMLVSVPRIYERTEASPIVIANTLENNVPESVGVALPGAQLRLGDREELLVQGPNLMLGYWNALEKTREAIDAEGWLQTGDVARIDAQGRVFIVGRLKEILVMSNGEKVPPGDLELAICEDPLFEQAMALGEGRPYLATLIVLNPETWRGLARSLALEPAIPESLAAPAVARFVLARLAKLLRGYPVYARMRGAWLTLEPWTIDNGLVTPTMKLKRPELERHFAAEIARLYAGHDAPA